MAVESPRWRHRAAQQAPFLPVCNHLCQDNTKLKQHFLTHLPNGFWCKLPSYDGGKVCGKNFRKEQDLRTHQFGDSCMMLGKDEVEELELHNLKTIAAAFGEYDLTPPAWVNVKLGAAQAPRAPF